MGRGFAWLDTGTHDSLLDAASLISTLQKRQGLKVSCPEEIAYGQKWITTEQLQKLAAPLAKNGYGRYLMGLVRARKCRASPRWPIHCSRSRRPASPRFFG